MEHTDIATIYLFYLSILSYTIDLIIKLLLDYIIKNTTINQSFSIFMFISSISYMKSLLEYRINASIVRFLLGGSFIDETPVSIFVMLQ